MARSAVAGLVLLSAVRSPAAFDPTDANMMAYAEQAVYCGKDRFERWDVGDSILHGPKVDRARLRFVRHDKTDASAGVGRMMEPEGCFVAIKGTTGAVDSWLDAKFWFTDFDRKDCKGCRVDNGFSAYYESIKDGIFKALDEFGCKDLQLYLVGHSLGAAGLTYNLFDLLVAGYKVKRMYALESPRPGNQAFADALAKKMAGVDAWRVAHFQDVVVHLPPPILSYRHALPEIYFFNESGKAYSTCGREDGKCSNKWPPWELNGKDHCWYADRNPCGCSNSSHTPPSAPELLSVLV